MFWTVLLAVVAVIALVWFVVFATRRSILAHRRRVAAGREDLVGRTAVVEVPLNPKGVVLVEGERWTAVLDRGQAAAGDEVVISRVEGLKLQVSQKP